jgi:hypothetical protein
MPLHFAGAAMNLQAWADISTLVSGGAVLASVLYLAVQVRQGARHQRGAIGHGRSQHIQSLIQSVSGSPALAETILKGWAGDPSLDRVAYTQFYWFVFAIFVAFEDTFLQYREGMIGKPVFNSARKATTFHLSQPGSRAVWQIARGSFDDGFVAYMDELMGATPPRLSGDSWEVWKSLVAQEAAAAP